MKKHYGLFISAILLTSLFSGCSKKEQLTFTVGFDTHFTPFCFTDSQGQLKGYDLDLAAEVAKRNNWKLVAVQMVWMEKDNLLNSGKIDCIWSGFTINGREKLYTWSVPYASNSQVVLVKPDSGIVNIACLKDKIVAIKKGTTGQALLKSDKFSSVTKTFSKLLVLDTYDDAFNCFMEGKADAMIVDSGYANYKRIDHEKEFLYLDEKLADEKLGIAFKLGATSLKDQVENTLRDMVMDGTMERLSKNWFGGVNTCILK